MSDAIFWSLVGSFVTSIIALLGIYIAQRTGYVQISFAREAHELAIAKAEAKIGTIVRIDKTQPNGPHYPTVYHVVVTIYNAGELAAKELNGKCRLFSPINEVQERSIPIKREFLHTAGPYDLNPTLLWGTSLDNAMGGQQSIHINIDIQFEYSTLSDNKTYNYNERYAFDNESRQFLKQ